MVEEIEFGTNGTLTRFAARWEQHCIGVGPTTVEDASFGSISYNATVPFRDRSVTPAAVVFRTTPGTPAPTQSVTVANHGSVPLRVDQVSVVGPQASEFTIVGHNCTGRDLGSCSITVRFAPDAANTAHVAALRIVDDTMPVPGDGFQVSLQGTTAPGSAGFVLGEADDGLVGGRHVNFSSISVFRSEGVRIEATSDMGPWAIHFVAPNQGLFVGTYDTETPPLPFSRPPSVVVSPAIGTCALPLRSRFTIDDIAYDELSVSDAPAPTTCSVGAGRINLLNAHGTTHYIVDVFGYFRA